MKKLGIVNCLGITREAIDKIKSKIEQIDYIANPGNESRPSSREK
jgi:hypothetical protein